jgi:hypothetical protein
MTIIIFKLAAILSTSSCNKKIKINVKKEIEGDY